MRTLKNIIAIAFVVLFAMNCKNEAKPEIKTVEVETSEINKIDPIATYAKAEFTIDGMSCAIGCAATIEKKISKMDGVKSAKVDFDKKLAMVEYDEAKVTPTSLIETVSKVGDDYKVSNMKTVESFDAKELCTKACCEGKSDSEKANCKNGCCANTASTEISKTCGKDCNKPCCAEKAKAKA